MLVGLTYIFIPIGFALELIEDREVSHRNLIQTFSRIVPVSAVDRNLAPSTSNNHYKKASYFQVN
jgi:hypothetical protein